MSIYTTDIKKTGKQKPGLAAILYIGIKEDMTDIPGLPSSPATIEEHVTIADPIVFLVGKGFIKVELYARTGVLNDTAEGEIGSEVNTPTVTGFAPESKALKYMLESGAPVICMVKPAQCTDLELRQLGDDCEPAQIKGNFTSSTSGGSDRRGYDITVTAANEWVYNSSAIAFLVP